MNTKKVYVGDLKIITESRYIGDGVSEYTGKKVRSTIVYRKENAFIDLWTKEKYYKTFLAVEGTMYLDYDSLISLEDYLKENKEIKWKRNMTKRKMKRIGK